jgi:transforming growth factor-beta-induced protein
MVQQNLELMGQLDLMFQGGVMHIIDTVLTIPISPSFSALDSNLTALAGALTETSIISAVDGRKDLTIFAPSNAAVQAIGSATGSLTTPQFGSILEYHVIDGTVGYSSLLTTGLADENFPTLQGGSVTVEVEDGNVFANSAQVGIADIIIANGVMHVVNNVLNPSNSTATPIPTATSQAVALAGAAEASTVPFTSGNVPTTTGPSTSTGTAGAGKIDNGDSAGVAAALFGMAVLAVL